VNSFGDLYATVKIASPLSGIILISIPPETSGKLEGSQTWLPKPYRF
jgi:hypothetical protein